jgi:hypothetical protein
MGDITNCNILADKKQKVVMGDITNCNIFFSETVYSKLSFQSEMEKGDTCM